MQRRTGFFLLFLGFSLSSIGQAQNPPARSSPASASGQVEVAPPIKRVPPPSPGLSAEELTDRGDELRAEKNYLDALDYYHAATAKKPNDASIWNRLGIAELLLQRWKDSRKDLERAIRADHAFADAYNNVGVVDYQQKKYGRAIREYQAAIRLRPDEAPYYSNLGAAYFSRKDFENAALAYGQALQLDPDIFEHSSRNGVAAQLPSPEDRAHYDYVMAKLYAKAGANDRSLEHLKRAMEEGYKKIDEVYTDKEFTDLRRDPRFTQLMAARPTAIPE